MNIQVQQPTQKRVKLDAIISCLSRNGAGGVDRQNEVIAQWSNHATRIIVVGGENPVESDNESNSTGYDFLPSKDPNPSLVEALDYYIRKGKPEEFVMITAPSFLVSDDHSELFKHVADAQLNRAWAGKISVDGAPLSTAPDAFVFAGYVMQYLVKDIPDSLTFMTNTWAKWIDAWCQKRLQPNRYFNASFLNLLSVVPPARTLPDVIPDHVEVPEPQVDTEVPPNAAETPSEPAKAIETAPAKPSRPRGRPKGWRKNPVPATIKVSEDGGI